MTADASEVALRDLIRAGRLAPVAAGLDFAALVAWVEAWLNTRAPAGQQVVAVIGGPAAGKTTLVNALAAPPASVALYMDDVNLGDRPWRRAVFADPTRDATHVKDLALLRRLVADLLRLGPGEPLRLPVYDPPSGLAVGRRPWPRVVHGPIRRVVIEEIFDAFPAVDYPSLPLIYLHRPDAERLRARLIRDVAERGFDEPEIRRQFEARQRAEHLPFTLPALRRADLVIRATQPAPDAAYHYAIWVSTALGQQE